MADLFMWLFGISVASFSVLIVWLFLWIIRPALNSYAWDFIVAKRSNKPLAILDAGSHWVMFIGEKIIEGFMRDKQGNDMIEVGPNSMKYGKGVLMGVGEAYRAKTANVKVVDFITRCLKKGWDINQLKSLITDVDIALKEKEKGKPVKPKEGKKNVATKEETSITAESDDGNPK